MTLRQPVAVLLAAGLLAADTALSELWGQPVVIENGSGAGGTLAWAMAAQASPEGHTLTVASASGRCTWRSRRSVHFTFRASDRPCLSLGTAGSCRLR